MNIKTFQTEEDWVQSTIEFILSLNPKNVALSGGSTPKPIYQKLAEILKQSKLNNAENGHMTRSNNSPEKSQKSPGTRLSEAEALAPKTQPRSAAKGPSSKRRLSEAEGPSPKEGNVTLPNTQFFQVDERYVPKDHPDSNQRMITESGLTLHHTFNTSLPIQESIEKYSQLLPEELDLTILGIGPDGHTASLFPHQNSKRTPNQNSKRTPNPNPNPNSNSTPNPTPHSHSTPPPKTTSPNSKTAHTIAPPEFAIPDRLTLTFPTILNSTNLLILLKNKPQILQELQSPTKSATEFPAHKLTQHPKLKIFALNQQNLH